MFLYQIILHNSAFQIKIWYIFRKRMELLRNQAAYERNKNKKNAKIYEVVRKQQIGNVERKIYRKLGSDGKYKEYVKYNGRYVQLKNYKEIMKKKNLYKSPSPVRKSASPVRSAEGKKCKKDCAAIKKVCNKKTGRCNNPKKSPKRAAKK